MVRLTKYGFACQTSTWHINSPKRIACCIYLHSRKDYITVQNNNAGSLCAERAAVTIAVCKYPDLKFDEIANILIIGESNPILPCGVCCEWLYKINPYMNLYTLKDDRILKINTSDYYGDENTIESR